jgi:GntR family transcriptional regulator
MTIPMGYRKIAADLRARIDNGDYPPGSKLPTYTELASLYSTSVSTAQRAVMLLQAQGVIVGVQGAGLYVAE